MDIDQVITEERNMTLAAAKITNVFIEGLHDQIVLPDVHSEATEATHILLGCDLFAAMSLLAMAVHQANIQQAPPAVVKYVDGIFRDHLLHHACSVVTERGPIGEYTCGGQDAQKK